MKTTVPNELAGLLNECIQQRAELLEIVKAYVRYIEDPFSADLPDLLGKSRALIAKAGGRE